MVANSNVNPNFPLPGIDQPSKGFRDNFTVIKQEIEALQGKAIQLTGDITSGPTMLDAGTGVALIITQSKVYRRVFTNADVSGGILTVNHNLAEQIVITQVSNNLNQVIQPDLITLTSSSQLQIDLSSHVPIVGNWNVIVRA